MYGEKIFDVEDTPVYDVEYCHQFQRGRLLDIIGM